MIHRLGKAEQSICSRNRPRAHRGWLPAAVAALLLAFSPAVGVSDFVLVQFDSPLRYLANVADPGIGLSWKDEGFDDSLWASGSYGVGYETSLPGAVNLLRTTVPAHAYSVYTRARFTLSDLPAVTRLFLGADYDDGYVAWINGIEIYRSPTMPAGNPTWNTDAASHESSNGLVPNYGTLVDVSATGIPALHAGENVLSVGVWNTGALTSTDLVLVPRLSFTGPAVLTRGPYLQMSTPTSVAVRFRTDIPVDARVWYGTSPDNLTSTADSSQVTTEHVVTLSGLTPQARYYYVVGTSSQPLVPADATYSFVTAPDPAAVGPLRIWVVGDSGTAGAGAAAVRDAYAALEGGVTTNLWLMLGDNAYPAGTDLQYQAAVFDLFSILLRKSPLFPAIGNHDSLSSDSQMQTGPYFDLFTLPAGAELGGIGSGTEAYYSFDYGNIHFICLDSSDSDRSPTGSMLTWARQDALSTAKDWTIAYWHHPPYSKASHNSDTEIELIQMRQNALPILEEAGVDLVLTGHSHSYERSYLLDGHYGLSTTFNETMKKDGGDGRLDGQGPYRKPSTGPAPHEGTVYAVAGTGGEVRGGTLDHPANFLSLNVLGSLVLDVNGRQLDARFLDSTGTVRDYFTIQKGPDSPPVADFVAAPQFGSMPLSVAFTDTSSNDPSTWSWDFEDDGSADSGLQNPTHVYEYPGIYSVRLTASNAPGSSTEVKSGLICVTDPGGLVDVDDDGVPDPVDLCPCINDPGQENLDGDGMGDACDPDDDNDGVADAADCAPLDPTASSLPADVGNGLRLDLDLDRIMWTAAQPGVVFNVYQGSIGAGAPFGFNHLCLEAWSPDPVSSDPRLPGPDEAFYYLVSGWNPCGEGSLGVTSNGQPRPNANPCP